MSHEASYRADIDGLRALAIMPVVMFHAFPNVVPGGFVGVDVFFVISGYLISLLILEHLAEGTFSLSTFYARRVRRIFPALLLVLAACLVWGWFRLFATDFALLGKHVAGSAGFAANLLLWTEAGYFDQASEAKPLLHLWSLGIEEQFYLVWPTLVVVAWRWRRRVLGILAAVLVLSFTINAVVVRTDETAAFYSPVTRLWELLLGGALAHVTLARSRPILASTWTDRAWQAYSPEFRNVAAIAGLAAIVASIAWFDADTSFPGWRAALPTVGTLLLIAAGPDGWLNRRVLATRALVWVGLISYPLYLWHWPLLSFATLSGAAPTAAQRVGLIAVSLVLATFTYLLVERPVRFHWRGRTPVVALCVLMTVAAAAGYVIFAREGFHDRPINRSDKAHFLEYYQRLRRRGLSAAYRAECDFMDWATEATRAAIHPDCTTPGEHGTVFLWGDSHAQALSYGIRTLLPDGISLAQVTTSACPPRFEEANPLALNGRCAVANAYAHERIAALKPHIVVLAQILAHDVTDWAAVAKALRALGAGRVVLIGPTPQWLPTLPAVIVNHHWDRPYHRVREGLHRELFDTDRLLRLRYPHSDHLEYISLLDALCDEDGCVAAVPGGDNQLLVVDNGHLSPAGSVYVADTVLRPHLVVE